MAVDKTLFTRLRRLFSTNVVVRQVGGKKLKVSDTSRTQSSIKHQLIDRYQKIYSNLQQYWIRWRSCNSTTTFRTI